MAFVVKKLNLDELDKATGTYVYEPNNITVTLRAFTTARFQKAYGMILERERENKDALKGISLGDDFLDAMDDDKSVDEMIARAIGKFLIVSWDIEEEGVGPLEVTADNYIQVLSNLSNPIAFVQWCMDKSAEVSQDNSSLVTDTKKKQSPGTSGKKTTKSSPTSKKA